MGCLEDAGNKRHVEPGDCQPVTGKECLEPRVEVGEVGSLGTHGSRSHGVDLLLPCKWVGTGETRGQEVRE